MAREEPWNYSRQAPDIVKARSIPDMHAHTRWCNHAHNNTEDIIATFLSGVDCHITEHAPLPSDFLKGRGKMPFAYDIRGMNREEMGSWIRMCNMQKEQVEGFAREASSMPCGIELDYLQGYARDIKQVADSIDSVLRKNGSRLNHIGLVVHNISGVPLFNRHAMAYLLSEVSAHDVIRNYFESQRRGIEEMEGYCDFMCHPGIIHYLINRAGAKMMEDEHLSGTYIRAYKDFVDFTASKDICLEINTSGLERDFLHCPREEWHLHPDRPHPHMPYEILKYAIKRGVRFTVGSDWHNPGEGQRYFDQVHDVLKQLGVKEVYKIVNREKVAVGIS